jgi:hypothetical protein
MGEQSTSGGAAQQSVAGQPPGQQTYAGDQQQVLVAQAEAQNAQTQGGLLDPVGDVLRTGHATLQARQYAEEQARRLQQNLETRNAPPMSGSYYPGYEHEAMKAMVNDNLDPAQVNDSGLAWNNIGNTLIEFQAAFTAAANRSTEDWSGAAGDAARSHVTGLGDSMGSSGQGFQLAANQMYAQSQAAEQARNAMPEPVQFSMGDALGMLAQERNPFALPGVVEEVNQKFEEKKQAHEQAAQVMTTYSQSLTDAGTAMPAFAPPPTMAPPPPPPSNIGDPGGPGVGGNSGGIPFSGTGTSGGGVTTSSGAGSGPVTAPPRGPGGPGGSGPNNGGGAPRFPVPNPGPFPPGRPSGPGGPSNRPGGRPGGPGGPGGRGAPGGVGGRGVGGGMGAGRGFGPTGGGFGPTGSGAGGSGSGARLGGMPGEGAAGGRGAAGAAGGRGGAGMGGMGAGAGRGQGGEDSEHQRPNYLVEPDPDAIFGTDRMTAPPVIE